MTKRMERAGKRDRRTMWLLAGLIALACLLIFNTFLFGNDTLVYSDTGADTKEQYIMTYNDLVNRIRCGDLSFWDFHYGMGVNTFLMKLTNPFLLVIYLLGALFGAQYLAPMMVWLLIAEVMLCGLLCYLFLSEYQLREDAKLIASFLYAFSGYLLIWGQHYMFGASLVYLPLLALAIERAMKSVRASFAAALVTGLIVMSGYYTAYMILLTAGLYLLLRLLLVEQGPLGQRLKVLVRQGLSLLFGVSLGALNLLTAVSAADSSSRLSSSSSLFTRVKEALCLWTPEYYHSLIYRLLGNNLQGPASNYLGYANYYETLELFFGVCFVLLLAQYVCHIHRQNVSRGTKTAQYLGLAWAAFVLLIKAGSLIYNGFMYSFCREAFVFLPFFAIITAGVLTRILDKHRLNLPVLIVSTLACAAIYVKSYRNLDWTRFHNYVMWMLLGLLVCAAVLAALHRGRVNAARTAVVLAAAIFATQVYDGFMTFQDRAAVQKNDTTYFEETYSGDTTAALSWIKAQDDQFYRVEKDYSTASWVMDSMARDYCSVSMYNSLINARLMKFVKKMWPQLLTGYDSIHLDFGNSVHESTMAALTGVKYFLSKEAAPPSSDYELVHREGSVYVFRNTRTENIAHFYTKTMMSARYGANASELNTEDLLASVLVLAEKTEYAISGGDSADDAEDAEDAEDALDQYRLVAVDLLEEADAQLTGETLLLSGDSDDGDAEAGDEPEPAAESATEDISESVNVLPAEPYEPEETGLAVAGGGALTGPTVLSLDTEALEKLAQATIVLTVDISSDQEVELCFDDGRANKCYVRGTRTYTMSIPAGAATLTIEPQNPETPYTITGVRTYGAEEVSDFSDAAVIDIPEPERDDHVTGTIEASESGYVLLAIPYQKGWTLTVDGETVQAKAGDYGMTAFEVSEGSHTFEMNFVAPYFYEGLAISLISLALWIIGLVIVARRRPVRSDGKQRT